MENKFQPGMLVHLEGWAEDHELEASLYYISRPCFKAKQNKNLPKTGKA
jgi:hypothetical protein